MKSTPERPPRRKTAFDLLEPGQRMGGFTIWAATRRTDLRLVLTGTIVWLTCVLALDVQAGGSGLNTVVVVNQFSSNSCEVANYYCERRQVPPENVLRINWAGNNISWTSDEYQTNLLNPLLTSLVSRRLTNQIDYVVLSMDIPYQTWFGSA